MNKKDNNYIGKGSYGVVTKNGDKVIKTCKVFCYDDNNNNDFYLDDHSIREAIFYKTVSKERKQSSDTFYKGIPNVSVTIQHNQSLLFEMDYLGTTLTNFKYVNKDRTIKLFSSILLSLYSIHKHGFTHGDLKPENILIDKHENVTIIDYGSICFWHNSAIYPNSYQRCTLYYVSPEELSDDCYSDKNDMWSFGVILFEFLTGNSFVRTLLKDYEVNDKDQELFYEYTMNIKKDNSFNPTLYLSNFYNSIQYSDIFKCISKYIKDRDFLKVIGHCLLKDVKIRCSAEKLLESNVFKVILPKIELKQEKETLNTQLNDPIREKIHDTIWNWCNDNFKPSLYGHSIMLFDRILLRMNETSEYIPYLLLALCCTVLSAMILKGKLIRASTIESIYNETKSRNDEETDIHIIKYYLGIIFSHSQFFLLNKSPDMYLHDENIIIDYDLFRKICKQYILTSSTSLSVVDKYKSESN
jgi:serine/threonine protein kinase